MKFSNNIHFFLKNVNNLPYELIDIIYEYLPKSVTIFLTKKNYLQEHYLIIKKYINGERIENYIRTMIRQDNDFVLRQLLVENYRRWLNMTKCYYKTCIYTNYITFLESYAIDNESIKCRKLITKFFLEVCYKRIST